MTNSDYYVTKSIDFAKKLAFAKKTRLERMNCRWISLDELESAAYMGLVQAAKKFKSELSTNFEAFASKRVNGAMNDYLAEISGGSKQRMPLEIELEIPARPDSKSSMEVFEAIISPLPDRTRVILRRFYIHEDTLKEISKLVSLHQSRISQIINEARETLREIWRERRIKLWEST